jgi:protein-tyrosine phosphatase
MNWWDDVPISKIYDRLYVGGYVQASRLNTENPLGITTVLDVSTSASWERSVPYVEAENIDYCHIPFPDGEDIPEKEFWECLNFLEDRYDKGCIILVHCAAGISRSVVLAASFMHFMKIMDFLDALEWIKKRRKIANPHVKILTSAKKILKIWPYGTLD